MDAVYTIETGGVFPFAAALAIKADWISQPISSSIYPEYCVGQSQTVGNLYVGPLASTAQHPHNGGLQWTWSDCIVRYTCDTIISSMMHNIMQAHDRLCMTVVALCRSWYSPLGVLDCQLQQVIISLLQSSMPRTTGLYLIAHIVVSSSSTTTSSSCALHLRVQHLLSALSSSFFVVVVAIFHLSWSMAMFTLH